MKLTIPRIADLKCEPGKRDRLVFDDEQKGLAVRVTATGSKSYLAQYTIGGQRRRVPLGSVDAVALADARKAAEAIMGKVAMGADEAKARKAAAAKAKADAEAERLTLAVLVDTWDTMHLAHKRKSYAVEAVRAMKTAFPRQWDKPAEALTRTTVVRVLDDLAKAGTVAMANRTAAYGRACFQWAMKRGTIATNPFAALPAMGDVPTRDRVLTDDELAEIWRAAEKAGKPFGRVVQFLALTGQRRDEVAGMEWSEVAADLSTWTIPATRAKNGAAHIVPLSPPAKDLLKAMPRISPLVFPGEAAFRPVEKEGDAPKSFSGWSKSKARLDALITEARRKAAADAGDDPKKVADMPGWRLHDLRRTMATGLQRLGIRLEVTEAVLNHVSGTRSGIVGVYQRHDWADEKRAALDAWGKHVQAAIEGRATAGNVLPMKKKRGA